jgi:hypothetical protein
VKCAGGPRMLSQSFMNEMLKFTTNETQQLQPRQVPKGPKGMGGAASSSGGGGGVNGCGEDERGHLIKGGGTGMAAHMAYRSDGYYVAAASCYIAKKFKEAGGAAGGR